MAFLLGLCFAWLALHAVAAALKHLCGVRSLGIGVLSISVQTSKCNRSDKDYSVVELHVGIFVSRYTLVPSCLAVVGYFTSLEDSTMLFFASGMDLVLQLRLCWHCQLSSC